MLDHRLHLAFVHIRIGIGREAGIGGPFLFIDGDLRAGIAGVNQHDAVAHFANFAGARLRPHGAEHDAHAEPLGFGNARRKHFRRAIAILEGDEVGTDLVQGPYVVDRFLAVMHAAVAHTRPVIVGPVGVRAGAVERHRGLVEPWTTENTVIDRIARSQTLIVAPGTDHGGGHAPVQEGFAIHPIPVRLGVHQARKHPFPAGVDDLRPGRNLNLTGWAHSGDPVALHDDYGILNRRPAKAVDQGPPLNDKGALLLSPGAVGQRRAQCHQDCAGHQHSA